MGVFNKIQLWFINDWKVVWILRGCWVHPITTFYYAYVLYEIKWSSTRNKYKLKMSGFKPKEHPHYLKAISKLDELNTTTTDNP